LGLDGVEVETNEHPGDGTWYRFFRQYLLTAAGAASVSVGCSAGSVEADAVKYEREDGTGTFIEPTAFVGGDWGAAVQLRTLKAENIISGQLTVGGADSNNPRISVLNGDNAEIVTIGDPASGFLGIEVKDAGGMRVSGSGDVAVVGGGRIYAGMPAGGRTELAAAGLAGYNAANEKQAELQSATGKLRILGVGGLSVENGASVEIKGGGHLLVGTPDAQRTEVRNYGVVGYNNDNEVIFALNEAGVVNGVNVDDGDVLIGNAGNNYALWDNSAGELTIVGTVIAGEGNVEIGTAGVTLLSSGVNYNARNAVTWVTDLSEPNTDFPVAVVFGGRQEVSQTNPRVRKILDLYSGSINDVFFSRPAGSPQEDGKLTCIAIGTKDGGQASAFYGAFAGTAAEMIFHSVARRIEIGGSGLCRKNSTNTNPAFLQWEAGFVELGGEGHSAGVRTRGTLDVRKLNAAGGSNVQLEGRTALTDINDGFLRVNHGEQYSEGVAVSGRLRAFGWLSVGNDALNFTPTGSTWATGGATLLLNGLDTTSIVFHDANNRVDAIVAGGGLLRIGPDIGFGPANVEFSGTTAFGRAPVSNVRAVMFATTNDSNGHSLFCANNGWTQNHLYIRGDGLPWVNQAWVVGSDERLKEDIADVPNALDRLQGVRPRSYYLRADEARQRRRHYGVVAQELVEVLPELVSEGQDGTLAVAYEELIPLLVGAVKELSARVTALEARLRS
jgi:hypothetical protein